MKAIPKIGEYDINDDYVIDQLPEDYDCAICMEIKVEMLECAKCEASYCKNCLDEWSKKDKQCDPKRLKYKCSLCQYSGIFNNRNKIRTEIFMALKFKCQGPCKQIMPALELINHKKKGLCRSGWVRPPDVFKKKPSTNALQVSAPPAIGQSDYFNQKDLFNQSRAKVEKMFILLKDSKSIYQINLRTQKCSIHKIQMPYSFPHNFQSVTGGDGNIYLVGGGDYQKDDDSLYALHSISTNDFKIQNRAAMSHPRHGHSAIWFGEKFIVVTGSRKEKNQSQVKCEMYNADLDLWFDMPDLNIGRHYHSSCAFSDKFVYIFCGIANKTRKYINSIERYDHTNRNKWNLIEVSVSEFAERQGCGVIQKDSKSILIFGGFSGKFRNDCYTFDVFSNSLSSARFSPTEIFSFQMPTVYDSETNAIYTAELQHKIVYKFDDKGYWKSHGVIN